MRNFPTFGMTIVVLTTAMLIPPVGIAKDELSKAFVFRERDAERNAPEKLDFRENASAMIEIDALSVFDSESTDRGRLIMVWILRRCSRGECGLRFPSNELLSFPQ